MVVRYPILLGLFLLAPSTFTTALSKSTSAKLEAEPQVIKLHRFRKALWTVRVTLNGKTGDFLFDTGGGMTFLTDKFGKEAGCKFWGRLTGYNMFGKRSDGPRCDNVRLKADGVSLTTVTAGKIDFEGQFPGDKAPDGLLSLDAFAGKAITIDQVAGTLTIETPGSLAKRTKRMKELPIRLDCECCGLAISVFVGVPRKEGMTWLILDSGAGGVSLIAKDFATIFGLDPEKKEQRLKFDIADGISVDSPVLVTDMILDGNLGQPFMSQYIITLDLANSRAWFQRAN
jgi:hypothetical protein